MSKGRVIIIDDEAPIREVLKASLEDEGYEIILAENGQQGLILMKEHKPQVAMLDIWMPGMDGMDVLSESKRLFPNLDVIMMSGHGTIETAVKATKMGAWDFIEKPLSMDKILVVLQNVLQLQSERGDKLSLLNKLRRNIAIVGESDPMVQLKQLIARVAPTSSWVLITGEAGTGKELVSQNIHYLSTRASRPFIDVNCAAIPEDLVEAELFGYEKGVFPGTEKSKKGKFDLANGGTIFFDEIADMSLKVQGKILRLLTEKNFQRVGGDEIIECDVRVIAASSKNLEEEIKAGRFREDLFYRLNVIPFKLSPLRERSKDVPTLLNHFSDMFAKEGGYVRKIFSDQAIERMQSYVWPGNVRELKNFIERVYILTPGDFVDVHDLRFAGLVSGNSTGSGFDEIPSFREARASFEKEYLLKKIAENHGNISKTAEMIGLERSYLHRKIKSYGIDV